MDSQPSKKQSALEDSSDLPQMGFFKNLPLHDVFALAQVNKKLHKKTKQFLPLLAKTYYPDSKFALCDYIFDEGKRCPLLWSALPSILLSYDVESCSRYCKANASYPSLSHHLHWIFWLLENRDQKAAISLRSEGKEILLPTDFTSFRLDLSLENPKDPKREDDSSYQLSGRPPWVVVYHPMSGKLKEFQTMQEAKVEFLHQIQKVSRYKERVISVRTQLQYPDYTTLPWKKTMDIPGILSTRFMTPIQSIPDPISATLQLDIASGAPITKLTVSVEQVRQQVRE